MEQVLLKVEQAAAQLGLGRSQVYRMVADGLLPTVRMGRAVRIPAAALRAWVEQHTSIPDAPTPDAATKVPPAPAPDGSRS